jgi:hypothetical protein
MKGKAPPPLGVFAWHEDPADLLSVRQYARLNRLVLGGIGHQSSYIDMSKHWTSSRDMSKNEIFLDISDSPL